VNAIHSVYINWQTVFISTGKILYMYKIKPGPLTRTSPSSSPRTCPLIGGYVPGEVARSANMVGGERTTCASTASSFNLRRANARRPLTHSLRWRDQPITLHRARPRQLWVWDPRALGSGPALDWRCDLHALPLIDKCMQRIPTLSRQPFSSVFNTW
jgi:hypothetical protein